MFTIGYFNSRLDKLFQNQKVLVVLNKSNKIMSFNLAETYHPHGYYAGESNIRERSRLF